MATYAEKLRDPRWQKMRLQVMERDEFKCRSCKSGTETLNVHHAYYLKGAVPWDYPLAHLITLCESCHRSVEKKRQMLLRFTVDPKIQISVLAFTFGITEQVAPGAPGLANACKDFFRIIRATYDALSGDAESDPVESFDAAMISMQANLFRVREGLVSRMEPKTNQQNEEKDDIPL